MTTCPRCSGHATGFGTREVRIPGRPDVVSVPRLRCSVCARTFDADPEGLHRARTAARGDLADLLLKGGVREAAVATGVDRRTVRRRSRDHADALLADPFPELVHLRLATGDRVGVLGTGLLDVAPYEKDELVRVLARRGQGVRTVAVDVSGLLLDAAGTACPTAEVVVPYVTTCGKLSTALAYLCRDATDVEAALLDARVARSGWTTDTLDRLARLARERRAARIDAMLSVLRGPMTRGFAWRDPVPDPGMPPGHDALATRLLVATAHRDRRAVRGTGRGGS